jgi:hypothetical protein
MKAPFPYFGGKSRVATDVWQRFGDVKNYVEPFFGSGAVLLSRPHEPHTETVNDTDGLLVNFWRSLQAAPEEVAKHADWPVSEIDLTARHTWLRNARADVERMLGDPEWYDAKAAGWWVWGISAWIGRGWCQVEHRQLPHLGDAGMGVNRRQLPRLGDEGKLMLARRLPDYLQLLSKRLARVRITCGDWTRVTGPSVTTRHGLTAVFLDPPYSTDERVTGLYGVDSDSVAVAVRRWAVEHGDDPLMRIALCGYDTEHNDEIPDTWERFAWKANGGYGSQGNGRGRANAARETIWFSPHCLKAAQLKLFKGLRS